MRPATKRTSTWMAPCKVSADFSDRYSWCKLHEVFIHADEVAAQMRADPSAVLVFDVRDQDAIGGHIAGAHHFPDSTFPDRLGEAVALVKDRAPRLVVFHCMESIRRGPRCAYRMRARLQDLRAAGDPSAASVPDATIVRVLRGGADGWIRKYWRTWLVDDFDNDYWGWDLHASAEWAAKPEDVEPLAAAAAATAASGAGAAGAATATAAAGSAEPGVASAAAAAAPAAGAASSSSSSSTSPSAPVPKTTSPTSGGLSIVTSAAAAAVTAAAAAAATAGSPLAAVTAVTAAAAAAAAAAVASPLAAVPTHSLYVRPADQVADTV